MTDSDERILKPKSGTVNPFWTNEEIMLLEQNYPQAQISPSDMEAIFGRRWSAIREKARSLGFRRPRLNYKEWTSKEISLLEQLYSNAHIAPREMENIFERRWETIAQTAQNIGLRRVRDLYTFNCKTLLVC
jgi:hypothetical protein